MRVQGEPVGLDAADARQWTVWIYDRVQCLGVMDEKDVHVVPV